MSASKKKILICSLVYYPDFVGGAEVAVKEITDRCSPEEIEFHMVTLRVGKKVSSREKIGNVEVYRVLGWLPLPFAKLLFPFAACFKAAQLNRQHSYTAVWAIMANYAGFAALFFKYLVPRVTFILTLQEGDPIEYIKRRVRFVYPLFKRIFTRADRIQAISQYLAGWAKETGARASIEVVPNGVDLALFGNREARKTNVRTELNLLPTDKLLITTSRLVVKNAVGDVIDSLLFLPPEVKFLVLGTGPLENDLRKKVEEHKLTARVFFLGYVPHEKLPGYLSSADIFIRPSLSEGMGNSFVEAMAAGIPVIATSVGGISDFLKDKETGLFCAVQDPKDIARKVTILLRDEAIRGTIIEQAERLVREKYDWGLVASHMKEKIF